MSSLTNHGLQTAGLLAAFQATLVAAPLADYPTESEALNGFFPGALLTKELGLISDPGELKLHRSRTPRHLFRYVARKDGKLLGVAVVDEVIGKSRPITYMLAVDTSGEVLGIEILAYRESHGHEISRVAFRRQFEGKRSASPLQVGEDIRNIAGATISCRAITNGVADILDLLAATAAPAAATQSIDTDHSNTQPNTRLPAAWSRTQIHMNAPLNFSGLMRNEDQSLDRATWLAATDAAFAEAKRLEELFSMFLPTSDVSRLNASASEAVVEVAPETRALLLESVALSKRTLGAFDPISGALTRLAKSAGTAPSEAARLAAQSQSGVEQLEFLPIGLRLKRRGAAIDLGSCAKGYALDRIAAIFTKRGITRGVLNFGGQVLILGQTLEQIDHRGGFGPIQLSGGSLATSGDDERGTIETDGKLRSHLVDPRSGEAITAHAAVQVFAPSAFEADVLATALYVLGQEAAWQLCLELDIAARFEASQSALERKTPAWKRHFASKL